MADDPQVVRSVSWTEVFSFTHIFKSFRMAIHPGKLILALAAILLCYGLGRIMDWVWSGASDACVVMENETWQYWTRQPSEFDADKAKWLKEDRVTQLVALMVKAEEPDDEVAFKAKAKAQVLDDFDDVVSSLKKKYRQKLEADLEAVKKQYKENVDKIKADTALKDEAKEEETARAAVDRDRKLRETLKTYLIGDRKTLAKQEGRHIFSAFLSWELHCLGRSMDSLLQGNITDGVAELYRNRGGEREKPKDVGVPEEFQRAATTNLPSGTELRQPDESLGAAGWLALMLWGLWWLFSVHPLYAIIYLLVALAIWSVLGGAICRVAALHAAREEKIGMGAAVKFGLSKFFSFYSAPLLPVGILVGLGVCIGLAGLVGAIPYVGEWLFVVLFGLCLIAGAICAFLLIGLLAGWPLMWPTIAVEGSDSFDAISRSVSYVWNRPFRYGLYGLIAGVYGTICYLFVRLFAFLTLRTVHAWAGWWMGWFADRPGYAEDASKLDVLWPQPTFGSFYGQVQWEALEGWWDTGAAYVLAFIVYLVLGVVLAFLATFFFSAATNIYFLLRQKMDVTDLDDVYIEEEPEAEEEGAAELETSPAEEPPAEDADEGETGDEEKSD